MKIMRTLAAVTAFTLAITACASDDGDGQKVFVGTDYVKHDRVGSDTYGFNVNIVSKKPIDSVEFVKFEGEHVQALGVTAQDDSYAEIERLVHNGHRLRLQGFLLESAEDYVRIDSVTLNIDGVEGTYPFATPVQNRIGEDTGNYDLYPTMSPTLVATNSYADRDTYYDYVFATDRPVTLEDFTFNSFLDADVLEVIVDGRSMGAGREVFPMEVPAGSDLTIRARLNFASDTAGTQYDSVYADAIVVYKTAGQSSPQTITLPLTSQSVSNVDDAAAFIDMIVGSG